MKDIARRIVVTAVATGISAVALGAAGAAFAQEGPRFLWGEGRARFLARPGGAPQPALSEAVTPDALPLWKGSFVFGGKTYNYTMVGTDPAAGSATTTIPVVVIPIRLIFASPVVVLSAGNPVCGGTEDPVSLALASPLFQPYAFAPGGTDVGTTQYIDAFQRANFWSEVSGGAPDYHVLLSPTVAPLQTALVPKSLGTTAPGPCASVGRLGFIYFDFLARAMIRRLQIPATSLPLFVTYNTFLTDLGGCCILGYHNVMAGGQTYAVADYSDAGLFDQPIEDIHAMSHELGEWLDDPFGVNPTPPWKAGQATRCQGNLEVGDPVTGTAFEATLGDVTYHPEDLVFLPWFARESPSSSVNGWYSFLDTFASPPDVCQ